MSRFFEISPSMEKFNVFLELLSLLLHMNSTMPPRTSPPQKRNFMTSRVCVHLHILVCIGQTLKKILCVHMPHSADWAVGSLIGDLNQVMTCEEDNFLNFLQKAELVGLKTRLKLKVKWQIDSCLK